MCNPPKNDRIVIIGAGKVGQSLNQLLSQQQYNTTLVGRGIEAHTSDISEAQLILITTNDSAIERVCQTISAYLKKGTVVSHCSGALSSRVLESAQQRGCFIASSHPLNTFPSLAAALKTFSNTQHNTYLYCEGDNQALRCINSVFSSSGFHIANIESNAKTAYHTACVFACNYLTVLMDTSLKVAELEGIDKTIFLHAIQPLVHATLNNINQHGTTASLSGPIARGDSQTVEQHLHFLSQKDQSIKHTYLALAQHALGLANAQGELSKQTLSQLNELITQDKPVD